MADRHGRHSMRSRSRSPPLPNTSRKNLPPINLSGNTTTEVHLHAVPSSRREVPSNSARCSSANTISSAGTVTTTYKIKTEPSRTGSSSTRRASRTRTRRSTLDNYSRPVVIPSTITVTPRHVHHLSSSARSESMHRSSEEDYVMVPSSSRRANPVHRDRHSTYSDTADVIGEGEREGSRLRIRAPREVTYSRPRSLFLPNAVRHVDTVADDYGENGYGYTNPRDLVQYDLDHGYQPSEIRHGSFDTEKSTRPNSISSFSELIAPKYYDSRERRPPPSTRGFDRIRTEPWDQSSIRSSGPSLSLNSPIESAHRFGSHEGVEIPGKSRGPSYHDREPRSGAREGAYEPRENPRRDRAHYSWHDNSVEQRGYGIRTDKLERPERSERTVRGERSERSERAERSERNDRSEKDRKEHRGLEAIATGLGIAGAALGLTAVKNASRDEMRYREEREERKRKEIIEDNRRLRDRENAEMNEMSARAHKEQKYRDEENSRVVRSPREYSMRERDDTDLKNRFGDPSDFISREVKERIVVKDDRARDVERREYRSRQNSSKSSGSDDTDARYQRSSNSARAHHSKSSGSDPKDSMNLEAVNDALPTVETESRARAPDRPSKESSKKESDEIRVTITEEREPGPLPEKKVARVVSPPREKPEEKPVKGILRQPREKFPEDPSPVREGVAPLKDARKDGIPPDARWTKISREMVNPEALELGKERFEAREDFVIVLRVLSRDEVQGYAELTQKIRASHEEFEEFEASQNRAARRALDEKREGRSSESRDHRRRPHSREYDSYSDSEDSMIDEINGRGDAREKPTMIDHGTKKATFEEPLMSGGLGEPKRDTSRKR